ncbi:MAG: ABC transporter ATP-binding protein [Thermoleophilia bacterium]
MTAPLLQVRGLGVTYQVNGSEMEAVRGVSFSVAAGSVLAIIGGSGAGKSSVAQALTGLHDPRNTQVVGEVMFDGADILTLDERQLDQLRGSGMAMVFQDPRGSLDPTMKVINQVAGTVRLLRGASRNEAMAAAGELLDGVGISEGLLRAAPYPHQLSSGQCQRVMIAIAMAGEPKLLIADEPTGSLDLTLQAQVVDLLKERSRAAGLSMVFITHDLGLAAFMADDLLVMHDGVAVESGSCENIMGSPGHEYTKAMLAAWQESIEPRWAE